MRGQVLLMVGCLLLLQFPHTCISTESLARHRRGLLDMIVTLWCYREKLHVPLLGINLYGCYCGTGGSGSPVDAVDKCCFLHDCCYYHSRISMKCYSKVKWELYHFSCRESQTQCMSHNMCGRMACECDKQLAECLTQARPSNKHFFYNRKDLCPGPKDTCTASLPNGTEVFSRTQEPPHKPRMVTKPSQSRTGNRKQSLGTSWMKNIWKVQSPRGKANA